MFLLLAIAAALAGQQEPPIDWQEAARHIVRLPPATFSILPAPIRNELEARHCTVPQPWDARQPHNVIRGHFTSVKADEWAVLCSVKGTSSILVFRQGRTTPIARLDRSPDAGYLQGTMPGRAGFSREITPISADSIRDYCRLWQHDCPPLTHDGIENSFVDKASWILYDRNGKWLKLAGAD